MYSFAKVLVVLSAISKGTRFINVMFIAFFTAS